MTFDLAITGMGGQGCVACGKVLSTAAASAGWRVAGSELRGGAQRGGAAEVQLRFLPQGGPGPEAVAAQVPPGGLDLLVGLEPLEAWRRVGLTSAKTLVVVDTTPVEPALARGYNYTVPPFDTILAGVAGTGARVVALDLAATAKARWHKEAMANIVALGWLAEHGALPFAPETVRAAARGVLGDRPDLAEAWEAGAALAPHLPQRLDTERLVLRLWEPTDAPALETVLEASRDHLTAALGWTEERFADVPAQIAEHRAHPAARRNLPLGVFDRVDGRLLGAVGLVRPDWRAGTCEVGIWMGAPALGQGYAREAALAVVRHAFMGLGLRRLEIKTHPSNTVVREGALRHGFRFEGEAPAPDGPPAAIACYALDREAWPGTSEQRREAL